jgi:short-subunit dehydrogenase
MKSCLLITGATGGLGSALVHECARRSYDLFLTDQAEDGNNFVASIATTYGIDIHYLPCDLTSKESRTRLIDTLQSENYRFWGLINVAGRDYEGAFLDKSREQILHLIQLTVEASVDMTHAILNLRDPDRRFLLINISSLAAFFPMPYKATYAASKRFLIDFTLAIREEISAYGTAMVVCPAGLPTHAESIRKLKAQGFWGKITMTDTQFAAQRIIEYALKDKAIYIPGFVNRVLTWLGLLLPLPLVAKYVGNRWRKKQKSYL